MLVLDGFAMRQLGAPQADDLYELDSERQGWLLINTSHQVIMNGLRIARWFGPPGA
ncbi:hypothetical protein [Streptomyces sp. NPDC051561]|uniref:hypothetical protein n=1 Tax=Streptomyces sp. NPDC051561 TaxID=3365658 RepID=UPI0037A5E603